MDTPSIKAKEPADPLQETKGIRKVFKLALKSRRTIKTWLRCCIALAAALVLMVATKTDNSMGQAAFFVVIVAAMLPPTLALSVFLLASTTLLLGMLVGWAWGNAAMASALSVRSASLFAHQQKVVQSSLNPNSTLPIALQIRIQTFHGAFLDPRSSAVYGAFLFIGTFLFATMRAYLPSLTLLSVFGSIVLDVVCATGPLLPTANYTLAKILIIPSSYYVAVAIASLVLVFPESLSHVWLNLVLDTFWTTLDLLRLQSEVLTSRPSDHEAWAEKNARGIELRTNLVNATEELSLQIKLIDLDTSLGRLGPADLKRFNGELKSIMFRASGLHSFQAYVNDINVAAQKEVIAAEGLAPGSHTPRSASRYHALFRKVRDREIENGHDLDTLVPILASASSNLRQSSESAVVSVINWMRDCNSRRWSSFFFRPTEAAITERNAKLVEGLQKLEEALHEFRTIERVKLIKPYERFFDPETRRILKNSDMFTSRSLYICFVFIDTIDAFSESISRLLKIIVEIDSVRRQPKLWFPGRISKVRENITNSNGEFKSVAGPLAMGTAEDPVCFTAWNDNSQSTLNEDSDDEDEERDKRERMAEGLKKQNPDAFPPTTGFGIFIINLAPLFRFFKSPEGVFAFRSGIVSIGLWIPAVVQSTAWFYYDNKVIWALVMAQTGLAVYAGDQIANFIVRIAGTLIGLLLGMAVWYIGAGTGDGNPYGEVIATTIIVSPFIFWRLIGNPAVAGLMTMATLTIVFVVGYSWVDVHQVLLSDPGKGIAIGWKRALLVIIGFTAAFIVMLFPNPTSSRVLARKTLASVIGESGNIFAGEVEAFLIEERRARTGINEKIRCVGPNAEPDDKKVSPKERRVRNIARRVIAVSTKLREMEPSLTLAKFEPQLAGRWPREQYEELFKLQSRILGSLALLITSFSKLDTKWCSALVHKTPFLNPNFLSDVFSTIAILSHSLMEGQPLPAYLPKLRERLVYHEYHSAKAQKPSLSRAAFHTGPFAENEKALDKTDSSSELGKVARDREGYETDDEVAVAAGPARLDGSSVGIELEELTLDVLLDEQLPAHSTAVVALSSLISRVDEVIEITRVLCGEATFRGYESLQMDYLDREERAIRVGLTEVRSR